MYEMILAARTSHSVNYGELTIGAIVAIFGSVLALNTRGCAEAAADFLGNKAFPALYHNEIFLRVPAAFFAILGLIFALINIKILFFGF
ncbi:hypothetical protein [Streptomyces sp. NPDC048669]|uniref:hypothetical protein n=1 Tax=Streptomyces sp. NPDC048669 TaxID=3155267 RepID=UPI0034361BC2